MNKRKKEVGYIEFWEGDEVTFCAFAIPKQMELPMHDHPGMLVLSSVICGTLDY